MIEIRIHLKFDLREREAEESEQRSLSLSRNAVKTELLLHLNNKIVNLYYAVILNLSSYSSFFIKVISSFIKVSVIKLGFFAFDPKSLSTLTHSFSK